MGQMTKFVAKGNTYTFPTDPGDQEYRDNFAQLLTRTSRLPFADGGFDALGDERGLSPIGNIQFSFYLVSETREGMQVKRDAARKMADWGVGRLYFQPTDTNLAERYTWARVNAIEMPEQRHLHTDLFQRVQVNFQASDPFWMTAAGLTCWGAGASVKWGDGTSKWGGGSGSAVSGISTNLAFTNNGNAYTQPTISIRPDTGQSCTDPIIRRIVNGEVVDEVKFIGTLGVGDYLFIDCRKLGVWLNGAKQYTNRFSFRNPWWIRLLPGSNTLNVRFTLSSDAAKVNVKFHDRYV